MTMAPRLDPAEVKARVSCVAVARYLGRTPAQRAVQERGRMNCPHVGVHKNDDPNKSCQVWADGWKCWKCHGSGKGGDVFGLWAAFLGLDVKRDFRRVLADVAAFGGVSGAGPLPPIVATPRPRAPEYEPPDQVQAEATQTVWGAASRVSTELDAWCAARGLDGELVAMLDLVRVADRAPVWHTGTGGLWQKDDDPEKRHAWEGSRRLLVPVWDARGLLVSVRGRCVDGGAPGGKKERAVEGHKAGRRVLACPLARRMLAGDVEALDLVRDWGLVVVEGVPDYLTAATVWGYANDTAAAPAVLGIWSGSVSEAEAGGVVLQRVPDGARVVLVPHYDPPKPGEKIGQGAKYMRTIAKGLLARCDVLAALYDAENDLNDTLQAGGGADVLERLKRAERVPYGH